MKTYRVMMDYCASPLWEYPYGCNLDIDNLDFHIDSSVKEQLDIYENMWIKFEKGEIDITLLDQKAQVCAILLKNQAPYHNFVWYSEKYGCTFNLDGSKA